MKSAVALSFVILLTACMQKQPVIPKEELAHQSDLTDGLREIAHQVGTYALTIPTPKGACPVHINARIASATIDYQKAVDVTGGLTGEGTIPLGPIILTPSVGGSVDRTQTVKDSYSFKLADEHARPHTQLAGAVDTTGVDPITAKSAAVLRDAIEGQLASILAGKHPKPCIQPDKFTTVATTQVQKKLNGGFSVNILVAKIGGTVVTSTIDTQTVTLVVDLAASAAFVGTKPGL